MNIYMLGERNRALFLDRDGVINYNHGFVSSQDNFDFIDGIFDLVKAARVAGYLIVVITNQSGIGRGYFSESQFQVLTDWMCEQFNKFNAPIDRVYYSPYHPTEGIGKYRKAENTRKPGPGMILSAMLDLDLNLQKSILVGDKLIDIEAGLAAGVGTNLFFSTDIVSNQSKIKFDRIHSLLEVVSYLEAMES
jgi:D-glycero-D-manno-heptose 1,7-bisphosphate phosphatase